MKSENEILLSTENNYLSVYIHTQINSSLRMKVKTRNSQTSENRKTLTEGTD